MVLFLIGYIGTVRVLLVAPHLDETRRLLSSWKYP
jgi:hypothetical protein